MFGRKVRADVSKLHPRPSELPTKVMNRNEVKRKQLEIKHYRDSMRTSSLMEVKIGDWVRVQGKDGITRDYNDIINMGKGSVVLKQGGHWALDRVCSRTSRKVAKERLERDRKLRKLGFLPGEGLNRREM